VRSARGSGQRPETNEQKGDEGNAQGGHVGNCYGVNQDRCVAGTARDICRREVTDQTKLLPLESVMVDHCTGVDCLQQQGNESVAAIVTLEGPHGPMHGWDGDKHRPGHDRGSGELDASCVGNPRIVGATQEVNSLAEIDGEQATEVHERRAGEERSAHLQVAATRHCSSRSFHSNVIVVIVVMIIVGRVSVGHIGGRHQLASPWRSSSGRSDLTVIGAAKLPRGGGEDVAHSSV